MARAQSTLAMRHMPFMGSTAQPGRRGGVSSHAATTSKSQAKCTGGI
jgi:hypothetical protein